MIPDMQQTTRDVHLEEERTSRSMDVKKRFGPIMARMRSNLAKIHDIEQGLGLRPEDYHQPQQHQQRKMEDDSVAPKPCHHDMTALNASRNRLKESMDVIRTKLTRLREMEDDYSISENRRTKLLHEVLRGSLSSYDVDPGDSKRERTLVNRCRELEQQVFDLQVESITQKKRNYGLEQLLDKMKKLGPQYTIQLDKSHLTASTEQETDSDSETFDSSCKVYTSFDLEDNSLFESNNDAEKIPNARDEAENAQLLIKIDLLEKRNMELCQSKDDCAVLLEKSASQSARIMQLEELLEQNNVHMEAQRMILPPKSPRTGFFKRVLQKETQ